ncbi:MAG: tetratricopeptide repeat protein, partial [Isosphaeraceae bacterium]
ELTFKSDGHFTWTATVNGKTRSFSGQYTAGEGLLTLVSDNGPAIVGRINGAGNGFNFQLIGSGPGDPGLTFAR